MSKAFVYTELQVSVPFDQAPWQMLNPVLKAQPGLVNKTWLSGAGNNSLGRIYEFDSLDNARKFAHKYFPREAAKLGAALTTRIFDGAATEEASRDMNSVHYR